MKWIKMVLDEIYNLSTVEWIAIVLTIIASIYYMSYWGYGFKSLSIISLMIVFGYMAGSMLVDLWWR